MKPNQKVILFSFLVFTISCSSENTNNKNKSEKSETIDSAEPPKNNEINQDWIDIQSKVSRMNSETNYDQIILLLGKPVDEYVSPTSESEYILFYEVPSVKGAMFWLTVDTDKKTFLYWSGEKNEN